MLIAQRPCAYRLMPVCLSLDARLLIAQRPRAYRSHNICLLHKDIKEHTAVILLAIYLIINSLIYEGL